MIKSSIKVRVLLAFCLLLSLHTMIGRTQDAESTEPPAPVPETVTESPAQPAADTGPVTELPTLTPQVTSEISPTATQDAAVPTLALPSPTIIPETPSPNTLPPEPPLRLLVRELFDNGDVSPWQLSAGWSLVAQTSGYALQAQDTNTPALLLKGDFLNVAVETRVLPQTGAAQISIRQSSAGNYTATLDASGQVRLFRSSELIQTAVTAASATGATLRLSALDGVVRVSVNGVMLIAVLDAAPLPAGQVALSADFTLSADGSPQPQNVLLIDDVFLWVKETEWALYPAPTPLTVPTATPSDVPSATPVLEETVVAATMTLVPSETAPTEAIPTQETAPETTGKDTSRFPAPSAQQIRLAGPATNDHFADALIVPATAPLSPYVSEANTTAATLETQEAVPTCDYNHTHSIWFVFTPATTASYMLTTAGSTYDTVLAVYTGAAVNALTQTACNDDASALVFTSQITLTLLQGTTYRIQLSGYNGRYGDAMFRIQQMGLPVPSALPVLTAPIDNFSTNNGTTPLPTLTWNTVLNAHHYEIQIDDSSLFNSLNQTNAVLSAANYSVNPLLPGTTGTTYFWRVRGLNINNQPGPWSAVRKFIVDTLAPNAPTPALPADNAILAALRPAFTWTAALNSGSKTYQLDIDDDPELDGLCDFVAPVRTLTNLPTAGYTLPANQAALPQGAYCWRVRAVDAAGNIGPDSVTRRFRLFVGTAPLDKAAVFTTAVLTTANVNFTWIKTAGATSHTLNVFDATCTTPQAGFPMDVGALASKVVPLTHGTYCWNVQAVGIDAPVPPVFRTVIVSPPAPLPPVFTSPLLVSAISADATPDFIWNATTTTVGGPFTYELQADNNGCTFPSPDINQTALALGHTPISNLADGVYCYRVRTVNSLLVPGAWSVVPRTITIDTNAPAAPTLALPADNAILTALRPTFTWTPALNSGSKTYALDIDDDPDLDGTCDFSPALISGQAAPTATYTIPAMSPALAQGGYCWRVRAVDAAGNPGLDSTPRRFRLFIGTAPLDKAAVFTTAVLTTANVNFTWIKTAGATSHTLNLFDATCTTPVPTFPMDVGALASKVVPLAHGTYCWNVQAVGIDVPVPPVFRTVIVSPPAPLPPVFTSPLLVSAISADATPDFIWNATTSTLGGPFTYELQADNSGCTFPSREIDQTGLALNHTPASNLADGVYCYRVRTVNSLLVPGAWSVVPRTLTIDTALPAAPTLALPADNAILAALRPVFTWTAALNSGSKTYQLDIDDDPELDGLCDFAAPVRNPINIATAGYTLPPLQPALPQGGYCWRVRAVDAAGNIGPDSVTRRFRLFIGTAPLDKAAAFTTAAGTTANVNFTWAAVGGAGSYTLNLLDATCSTLENAYPVTTLNKVLTLTHGTYCWNVQAVGVDNVAPLVFRTVIVSPPAPLPPVFTSPLLVSAISADTTPDFVWNATTSTLGGPFTYELQADNSGCTFPSREIDQTGLGLGYTPTSELADGVYCYRVRTVNSLLVPGAWSIVPRTLTIDETPTGTPVLVNPKPNSSVLVAQPVFTWQPTPLAKSYQVQLKTVDTSCDAMDVALMPVTTASFTPSSPLLNKTYYWCVRALDAAGNPSPWSIQQAVKIVSAATAAPLLNRFTTSPVTLSWGAISWTAGGGSYQVQVDNNVTFVSPEYLSGSLPSGTQSVSIPVALPLSSGTWYWRVRACPAVGACGAWSTNGLFTIEL